MTQDIELEIEILQLLQDVDPNISLHLEKAQEFAHHLANFTEVWATNSEDLDEYEYSLSRWIESNFGVDFDEKFTGAGAVNVAVAEETLDVSVHEDDEDDEDLAVAEME